MSVVQDEVTNFRSSGADLDYPGKLQQPQDGASEQTPLTQQNGNAPVASVPQQNTDSQVCVCACASRTFDCSHPLSLHPIFVWTSG